MRLDAAPIWDTWSTAGPFIGEAAPHGRVTVDKDWHLNLQAGAGTYPKCPIRWFQRADNSQVETEIPNVKLIDIDRNVDTDAASATITIYNTQMLPNADAGSSQTVLGRPGLFTWRFRSPEAIARWGAGPGAEWRDVLVPDALLRTYEGYGGHDKTLGQALADGNLVITGTWLVDTVTIGHGGLVEMKCRDMAKLLIEQHLYPPLVPAALFPHGLRYCRWDPVYHPAVAGNVGSGPAGNKRCVYERVGDSQASGSDVWQGGFDRSLHGHFPHEAFDGDDTTYWLSVGNDSPEEPFAVEWIEAACGDEIDNVYVLPWAGPYRCYVSVMENGSWATGAGVIDYNPAGIGEYSGADEAAIPFVIQAAVGLDSATRITLPRSYRADKVRFSFSGLYESQWGPYPFRAGVRQLGLSMGDPTTGAVSAHAGYSTRDDGNYRDYADIIRDFALWSGFTLFDGTGGDAHVFGNIEDTGAADTGSCIGEDQFAKKTVIDAMHLIRDIVAYLLRVDEEGGFRFESPNYFKAGNFDMAGAYTPTIPEIDEGMQMTEYQAVYSDSPARTDIIISSNEPTAGLDGTVTTHLVPQDTGLLRGIVRPLMLVNEFLTDASDQLTMARLIDRAIHNALVTGSVGLAANPCIGINDQVKLHERVTSETGIHYIRASRTTHDLDSGSYLMTLGTYRVGDESGFVVTGEAPANPVAVHRPT